MGTPTEPMIFCAGRYPTTLKLHRNCSSLTPYPIPESVLRKFMRSGLAVGDDKSTGEKASSSVRNALDT